MLRLVGISGSEDSLRKPVTPEIHPSYTPSHRLRSRKNEAESTRRRRHGARRLILCSNDAIVGALLESNQATEMVGFDGGDTSK